ncbi:spore germination protein [Tumebacillus permanentifrigoris]|uniref:Stage V sporulation protein AF n=1 Tax=Tumebacillus permanentifrigoris TaxID=378543 RepID=A0A316DD01_9BACL|nr:spore germination protein [Tumebacillus permanentifrigoris]PWK15874.1 stage V sporulation protein AF [Tumebacillus permanentifrigoris]
MPATQPRKISTTLRDNMDTLNRELGVGKSFDMICRELHYAGRDFALYFIDGFAKDDIMNRIMEHLANLQPQDLSTQQIKQLVQTQIGYLEVETVDNLEDLKTNVLSGQLVFLIDGQDNGILIDARTYPARGPEEPDLERVVRGARDGFTETMCFNIALTRRRIRDDGLRMEYVRAGARSKTDICVSYIEDIANPDLVELIKNKISEIEIDGLPMAEKTVEELVFGRNWNPYPLVRYTERPDVAAVHLLEGHVLIYVDTSPSVMITPTTFFHHLQHAEEFRQKPIIGVFVRWLRFVAILMSIFLSPLWLGLVSSPSIVPGAWHFLLPDKVLTISVFWQLLAAEFGLSLLRMAAVHTPNPLGAALGLVAALMIGQVAIDVGFFTNEAVLVTSIAAISTFATPSYELGLANQIVRIGMLALTGLFGIWGFLASVLLWLVLMVRTKALDTPYFWPLIPLNRAALFHVLLRPPAGWKASRPKILHPSDDTPN